MNTVYEPLNTVIVYPEFSNNGAEPLPTPEGWALYFASAVHLETAGRRYAILRAPIGTPVPPEGREVQRQVLPMPSGGPYVRGVLPLTGEEHEAIQTYAAWCRAGEVLMASEERQAWIRAEPYRTLLTRLPARFRDWAEEGFTVREVISVIQDPVILDPWVVPHHLSASEAATIATRLPGTELTTIVVREPRDATDRWTVAIGIGGHMRHLRGGYTSYEAAKGVGVHELLQARLAATAAMRQVRQNWSQWGIDWRPYLGTLTVVRAAPKQNAWSALLEPARVETIPDPNLGDLNLGGHTGAYAPTERVHAGGGR